MRRILVDENVPRDVRQWLAKNGFSIVDVSQIRLRRAEDHAVAEYAAKHDMPIFTLDIDFAQIYRRFQKGALTVIIIRANPATPANIIATLNAAKRKLNLTTIQNKLVIITKKRIRIIS